MDLIFAYGLFLLIGIVLGLIGGGGSILGVPVLVYLLHLPADVATGYSLFIVGFTSLIGAFSFLKKGDISVEALIQFAIPSMITVFSVRKFVIPALPPVFFTIGGFEATKQLVIMCVFSALILSSSYSMIKKRSNAVKKDLMWDEFSRSPLRIPFVIILGVFVGILSGFVGAGGGFIIIPVLVFFVRVPMKKAIGTSLSIIAINSLVGFTGNVGHMDIDWRFLTFVTLLCVFGILIGTQLSYRIQVNKLKKGFGWFTLIVGIFVFIKELFLS
ncbi:MAG: sulfite exporter TauE/SafE family protein [Bacteroidetes bacterium]|nr:sulfite exporter TauE/SafE family protein [Bacteroidota bacterium]